MATSLPDPTPLSPRRQGEPMIIDSPRPAPLTPPEGTAGPAPLPVGAKLAHYSEQWAQVVGGKAAQVIQEGVTWEWLNKPPVQMVHPSEFKASPQEMDLITAEVKALLSKGATEVVSPLAQGTPGHWYSRIFLVPKKDGGKR